MKPSILAIFLAGLVGWAVAVAEDVSSMEASLKRLVGQDVSVAVARLGSDPGKPRVVNGDLVYFWGFWIEAYLHADPAERKNPSGTCDITLTTDATTHVIKRYDWKESNGGCTDVRRKLAPP